MSKNPQYNQQSKSEVEKIYIYSFPKHGNWLSQHLYLKMNKGFHVRKNPKQQYLKVVTFRGPSFSKKRIYVYDHAA